MVASERQVSANRRNAQKSTGPKTVLGKKRSSTNAFTHGLSLPICDARSHGQLGEFSQLFAGDALDAEMLLLAEKAADAQADLVRIRKVKSEMFEQAVMQAQSETSVLPELLDSSRRLHVGEEKNEQLFVDAVRHILPKLIKVERYEKRAASRRDRAIHELASMKDASKK